VLGVMCKSHNWVSLRLDGSCSVKQRQALVDTFNDPQVRPLAGSSSQ
jgi:SNF2 family DNA or RNA helicase